jgi:hypothetical protein
MRGQLRAAGTPLRLPAALPGRRWSAWLEQTKQTRRRLRAERLETIARLQAEERQTRRSGEHAPNLRRLL